MSVKSVECSYIQPFTFACGQGKWIKKGFEYKKNLGKRNQVNREKKNKKLNQRFNLVFISGAKNNVLMSPWKQFDIRVKMTEEETKGTKDFLFFQSSRRGRGSGASAPTFLKIIKSYREKVFSAPSHFESLLSPSNPPPPPPSTFLKVCPQSLSFDSISPSVELSLLMWPCKENTRQTGA